MNAHKERIWSQTTDHGRKLIVLFGLPESTNPRELCKALHRIEARAHTYAERVCNGDISPTDEQDTAHDASILRSVRRVLGDRVNAPDGVPIIINGDPRGYALKIPDDWMREHNADLYRDMGGYGILCPDFD